MVEEAIEEVEDEVMEDEIEEETEDNMMEEEIIEESETGEDFEKEESEKRERVTTAFTGYGRRPEGDIVPSPRSKFLVVICKKCKNEQTVFSKATTVVRCQKCNAELVIPTGGEAIINARVVRVLG